MRKANHVSSSVHGVVGVLVVAVVVLMQRGEATTFTVGGSKGWTMPSDSSPVYNQWAEGMRFRIGDSLLFVYKAGSDSVLRVRKEDYTNCNTNTPLEVYTDGHTEFKFNQSGPYYFISGNKDNCLKNEKLLVVVLADRTKKTTPSTTTSSPPSPRPSTTLAPAPTLAPSPSTTTTTTPASAPTPAPSTTTAEAPAPSDEAPPPPSGAPSLLAMTSLVGSLVGSSLMFLAF